MGVSVEMRFGGLYAEISHVFTIKNPFDNT